MAEKVIDLLLVDPIRNTVDVVVVGSMAEATDVIHARFDETAATRPWVRSKVGTRAVRQGTPLGETARPVYEPQRNAMQRKLVELEMWWPKSKRGRQYRELQKAWQAIVRIEKASRA